MSSNLNPNKTRMSHFQSRRETTWPNPNDLEKLEESWFDKPEFPQFERRWTGAFDNEARASRMSLLVGNTLLPKATSSEKRWPGQQQINRRTWISPLQGSESQENFWQNEFDVERRPSFQSHGHPSVNVEKLQRRNTLRKEQIDQADGGLVAQSVLEYAFKGNGTPANPYLVHWIPNDPGNPMEFSSAKKWTNAMILAFAIFMVSVASSGFSQGIADLKVEFQVSQVIALLTTSFFVLGFAVGALILSPLSELYGRRELYIGTFGAFVGLTGGTYLSQSMVTVLVLRFLAGIAGSFTQAVAPAVVADMFGAQERGMVLSIYTLAGLLGQNLGPIICGFLDAAYGWRAIPLLVTACSLPAWIVLSFTFPETYAPVLLQQRAKKLTEILGKAHAVEGIGEAKTIGQQLKVSTLRPWVILIYEPIVTLLSLFLSVVHGTLFLLFAAYPVVYQKTRGWPQGIASLPFLALCVGIIISLFYVALVDQKRYAKVVEKNNGSAPPEARLPPAMLGAAALPIGLFWFAWTNDPSVYWLVSVSAGTLFGFGMVLLYMSLTNYIVDAYLGYAASALAASTVLRSIAGAVFPLFTGKMYDALGIHWASSIPAFLALVFVPCLVAFYKYGHIIRSKTRFGSEAAKLAASMQGAR
ncbi:membrane transporter [Pleomassaria siparia CBS 279.74]|uniref:Membrane transporter n=1 Tax=Pleomassaria siparia CBS 279.74 TaxID=1314801 RepID=A0A6G1JXS7_9PLEO|nr:membrane transporter [Pleomassaria siparia CBS 279.74]